MQLEQSKPKDYKIIEMQLPSSHILNTMIESPFGEQTSLSGQWFALGQELLYQYGLLELAEEEIQKVEVQIGSLRRELQSFPALQLTDPFIRARREELRTLLLEHESQYDSLIADVITGNHPYTEDEPHYSPQEIIKVRKQEYVNSILICQAELAESIEKIRALIEMQTHVGLPHEPEIEKFQGDGLDELAHFLITSKQVDISGHIEDIVKLKETPVVEENELPGQLKASPVSESIILAASDWSTREQIASRVYEGETYSKLVANRLNKVLVELYGKRAAKMGYTMEKRKNGRFDEIRFVSLSSAHEYPDIVEPALVDTVAIKTPLDRMHTENTENERFIILEKEVVPGVQICIDTSSDPLYSGYLVIQYENGSYYHPTDERGNYYDMNDLTNVKAIIQSEYEPQLSEDQDTGRLEVDKYSLYNDLSQTNQQVYTELKAELLSELVDFNPTDDEIIAALNRAINESNMLKKIPTWMKNRTGQIKSEVRGQLIGRAIRDFKLTRGQKGHRIT